MSCSDHETTHQLTHSVPPYEDQQVCKALTVLSSWSGGVTTITMAELLIYSKCTLSEEVRYNGDSHPHSKTEDGKLIEKDNRNLIGTY